MDTPSEAQRPLSKREKAPMHMTLPARYYTDPKQYEVEMERFFFDKWIAVGWAAAIASAGDYFLAEVGSESVIVVRGEDGRIHASYNVCRHRGTRLCTEAQGKFTGRIQCPYHAWTYGYDGRCLGAPHMNHVAGFTTADYPLKRVTCEVWEGLVFLNFSRTPQPLVEQLGSLVDKFGSWRMPDLAVSRRITYDIAANWKLIVQNYNECVHCPIIHPLLSTLTPYQGAVNDPPGTAYVGGSMPLKDGVETMSLDGKRARAPLPGLNEIERRNIYYYSLMPNLFLSLHPDYVMSHTLWPRSVSSTLVVCEWLFHPEETQRADFDPSDAVEFWDLTNREDWLVSELSQQGISSRAYVPGPYSPREDCLWAIDAIVRAETDGEAAPLDSGSN